MLAGATPFSTQFTIGVNGSKVEVAGPPLQWFIPGTMNSLANVCGFAPMSVPMSLYQFGRRHLAREAALCGTICGFTTNSCGSAGSTSIRTQWLSGQPKVSMRVKFSNTRPVFLL